MSISMQNNEIKAILREFNLCEESNIIFPVPEEPVLEGALTTTVKDIMVGFMKDCVSYGKTPVLFGLIFSKKGLNLAVLNVNMQTIKANIDILSIPKEKESGLHALFKNYKQVPYFIMQENEQGEYEYVAGEKPFFHDAEKVTYIKMTGENGKSTYYKK